MAVFGDFVAIPSRIAERYRLQDERARLRRARYELKRNDKSHGKKKGSHHGPSPFIAWDGEGPRDAGYALLGNSMGMEICHPYLGTEECLSLILDTEREYPNAIHIAFGFNYDVSMMLRELSWRHLTVLHKFNRTVWRDWEIEHIPHKWLKVKRGGTVAKIFDIHSFFGTAYVPALMQFQVGSDDELALLVQEKARRAEFMWSEINDIRKYFRLELRLMPELAGRLRTVFADAGYVPRAWHGPGALARTALSRHRIADSMAESPGPVKLAAQYAFAGGRFELFKAGHMNRRIYSADIRSAYPYFATKLPNLSRGNWRQVRNYEHGKFAVYHISYERSPEPYRCYPLFRRTSTGTVAWPNRVTGWYWNPEAALVANDPAAEFLDGWVFDEDNPSDRPFAWLEEYYHKRKVLKDVGNPAEYTFKLIINSVYGQLAQRAGWDRKTRTAPKSHQLEWAGWITSACRASTGELARICGDNLVSIDTDGIYSLAPFDTLRGGNQLGGWELSVYDDGIFWQSGIYCLKTGDEWVKAKTRGIPKGAYTADDLIRCIRQRESLKLTKNVFVGYGLALNGQRDLLNTWVKEPHEFILGGEGKRVHYERACESECDGDMHRLALPVQLMQPGVECESVKHKLPWLDPPEDMQNLIDDLTLYNADHLDMDEEWVRSYA